MAGINYVWSLTSLLNLSVTLALDLNSRTSHNIDCRQQTTFIEWKSIYFYSCLKLSSGSSFITSTMRHRCDQLMICRNDYFQPPLPMACLAELIFQKGVYKECTFLKILISICFKYPFPMMKIMRWTQMLHVTIRNKNYWLDIPELQLTLNYEMSQCQSH